MIYDFYGLKHQFLSWGVLFSVGPRGKKLHFNFYLSGFLFSEHAVTQPMSMAPRRVGGFVGGADASNMLSPRSSDTGGLGVKMVEYVLGTSPTSKDHLDQRMRNLHLVRIIGRH